MKDNYSTATGFKNADYNVNLIKKEIIGKGISTLKQSKLGNPFDVDLYVDRTPQIDVSNIELEEPIVESPLRKGQSYAFKIKDFDPTESWNVYFDKGTWEFNKQTGTISFVCPSANANDRTVTLTIELNADVTGRVIFPDGSMYEDNGENLSHVEMSPTGNFNIAGFNGNYNEMLSQTLASNGRVLESQVEVIDGILQWSNDNKDGKVNLQNVIDINKTPSFMHSNNRVGYFTGIGQVTYEQYKTLKENALNNATLWQSPTNQPFKNNYKLEISITILEKETLSPILTQLKSKANDLPLFVDNSFKIGKQSVDEKTYNLCRIIVKNALDALDITDNPSTIKNIITQCEKQIKALTGNEHVFNDVAYAFAPKKSNNTNDNTKATSFLWQSKLGKVLGVPSNSNVCGSGGDTFGGYRNAGAFNSSLQVTSLYKDFSNKRSWTWEIKKEGRLDVFIKNKYAICNEYVIVKPQYTIEGEGKLEDHTFFWELTKGLDDFKWVSQKTDNYLCLLLKSKKDDKHFTLWIDKGTADEKQIKLVIYATPTDFVYITYFNEIQDFEFNRYFRENLNFIKRQKVPLVLHYSTIWNKDLNINVLEERW